MRRFVLQTVCNNRSIEHKLNIIQENEENMTKSNELTTQYERHEKKDGEENKNTTDRHTIHILHNQQPTHI